VHGRRVGGALSGGAARAGPAAGALAREALHGGRHGGGEHVGGAVHAAGLHLRFVLGAQVAAGHRVHDRHDLPGGAGFHTGYCWALRPSPPSPGRRGGASHKAHERGATLRRRAGHCAAAFLPQARTVRSARHQSQLLHRFAAVMGMCRHTWSDIHETNSSGEGAKGCVCVCARARACGSKPRSIMRSASSSTM
jgi:hypothetical protein